MTELRYIRCTKYIKSKKEFYMGLIERGLKDFYMNPDNDGKDPFLYMRIFQYDPEKMRKKRDKFVEIQKNRPEPLKIKRETIRRTVVNYKYKRKDNQWAGDEYESKKIKNEERTHEEIEVKYDDEVHCYIQVDSKLPAETAMIITSEKNCLKEKDIIMIPEEKSVYQQMTGHAVISMTDHFQKDSFDVNRALTLISQSIPVKVEYNPDRPTNFLETKNSEVVNEMIIKLDDVEIKIENACSCTHKFRSIMNCRHSNETILEFILLNNTISQLMGRMTVDIKRKILSILDMISKILRLKYTHKGLEKTQI